MKKPDISPSNYVDIIELLESADRFLQNLQPTFTPAEWKERYYNDEFQDALTQINEYLRSLEGFEEKSPYIVMVKEETFGDNLKIDPSKIVHPYDKKISITNPYISKNKFNFEGKFTVNDLEDFNKVMGKPTFRLKVGTDDPKLKKEIEKYRYQISKNDPENQIIEFESIGQVVWIVYIVNQGMWQSRNITGVFDTEEKAKTEVGELTQQNDLLPLPPKTFIVEGLYNEPILTFTTENKEFKLDITQSILTTFELNKEIVRFF